MKLNALIVDDEHSGRMSLKIFLQENYLYLFDQVQTADSLDDAIKIIKTNFYNVIFLDINLNNKSGFELLPHLSSQTTVVFVTAYSEYAINAIKEKAFDYLLKPINPIEFKNCINRLEKTIFGEKNQKKYLRIKQQGETIPINIEEIEYLEANGPYSKICMLNQQQYTTAKTIKSLEDKLGKDFIRIHKSFIVNKALIKSFKKDSLTTKSEKCLSVSRVGYKELLLHF